LLAERHSHLFGLGSQSRDYNTSARVTRGLERICLAVSPDIPASESTS
jgi:hypothetical protein